MVQSKLQTKTQPKPKAKVNVVVRMQVVQLPGMKKAASIHTLLVRMFELGVFNPEQLTTWQEAVKYYNILAHTPIDGGLIGGGMPPLTSNIDTSGVYLPRWEGGPLSFPRPQIGNSKNYEFRFKNGFSGMNAGLVRGLFQRYPSSPSYVLRLLKAEVK